MFPAGVGVYWIMSNIISFVQTVILYNIFSPRKLIAKQRNVLLLSPAAARIWKHCWRM